MFITGEGQIASTDPKLKNAVRDFKNEVMREATAILSERMPQKLLHFNKIVSEKKSPWLKFEPHDLSFFNDALAPPKSTLTSTTSSTNATTTTPEFIRSSTNAKDSQNKTIKEPMPPTNSEECEGDVSEQGTPSPPPAKRLRMSDEEKTVAPISTFSTAAQTMSESGDITAKVITDTKPNPTLFPPHPQICLMVEEIKAEIAELIEMTGSIKLFIQLNVPRIEGGNNFGVQIQEEAVSELLRVEDAAFGVSNSIVEYFALRARFITKLSKNPNVCDYKEALKEVDEKKWMCLKMTRIDMRNNYAMLYDLLSKNWERVVKPRHADGSSMMY